MKSLSEIHHNNEGKVSDKWSIYLREYDFVFSRYREQAISLLEIGVQNGGSLEVWNQYFPNNVHIIGCDIDPRCSGLIYSDPRIAVVVGDANTDVAESQIRKHANRFDLIIDDGSHRSSDIIRSFARYFPLINEGGLFVAEDLHCSYWKEFEGGLFDPYSAINFFKRLVDIVNHEHWGIDKEPSYVLDSINKHYDIKLDAGILQQINSISFFNSICIIRKKAAELNTLGKRQITGKAKIIVDEFTLSSADESQTPDQSSNIWTLNGKLPEELVVELKTQVDTLTHQMDALTQNIYTFKIQITSLERSLIERENDIETIYNSRSWRLTKPLRSVARLISKLIRKL